MWRAWNCTIKGGFCWMKWTNNNLVWLSENGPCSSSMDIYLLLSNTRLASSSLVVIHASLHCLENKKGGILGVQVNVTTRLSNNIVVPSKKNKRITLSFLLKKKKQRKTLLCSSSHAWDWIISKAIARTLSLSGSRIRNWKKWWDFTFFSDSWLQEQFTCMILCCK